MAYSDNRKAEIAERARVARVNAALFERLAADYAAGPTARAIDAVNEFTRQKMRRLLGSPPETKAASGG